MSPLPPSPHHTKLRSLPYPLKLRSYLKKKTQQFCLSKYKPLKFYKFLHNSPPYLKIKLVQPGYVMKGTEYFLSL